MKFLSLILAGLSSAQLFMIDNANASKSADFLDYQTKSLQGDALNLNQFKGKVILFVNTASYCGFTRQYEGLENIYKQYKDKGLVVLGFPSNDFGEQEPKANHEIADFCRRTYSVDFPMVEKTSVSGNNANLIYKKLGKLTGKTPKWNFHKYLLNRSGTTAYSYESSIEPTDPKFVDQIEKLLSEK